jgi:hypothetical protein
MAYIPTFKYSADAASIKAGGEPVTPTASPVFEALISETQSLIRDNKGERQGLTELITDSMIEQAEAAFTSLAHDGDLPDGMREATQRRAEALSEAISESLSFAIVASIINFHGTSNQSGAPILTYVVAEPAEVSLNAPVLPVLLGIDPVTGASLILKPV